jgi:hypothetical protein
VSGWSWGTGDTGTAHPPPPYTTYESVCGAIPEPDPSPKPDKPKGGHSKGVNQTGGSGDGGNDSTAQQAPRTRDQKVDGSNESGKPKGNKGKGDGKQEGKEKGEQEDKEEGDQGYEVEIPSSSPDATSVTSSNPAGATAEDPGAPVGAFVALGVSAALGVLGAIFVRRRRSEDG